MAVAKYDPRKPKREPYEERLARYEAIKAAAGAKVPYTEIGEAWGISVQRVSQIVNGGPPREWGISTRWVGTGRSHGRRRELEEQRDRWVRRPDSPTRTKRLGEIEAALAEL